MGHDLHFTLVLCVIRRLAACLPSHDKSMAVMSKKGFVELSLDLLYNEMYDRIRIKQDCHLTFSNKSMSDYAQLTSNIEFCADNEESNG